MSEYGNYSAFRIRPLHGGQEIRANRTPRITRAKGPEPNPSIRIHWIHDPSLLSPCRSMTNPWPVHKPLDLNSPSDFESSVRRLSVRKL